MDDSHIVWRKSTHSVTNGCLEVAVIDGQVAVRDSKNRGGPILMFTPVEWKAFVTGVADGEFDHIRQMVRTE
jgi:Holliday junction resolvasome RuvABC endonuclease subunit